jgi:hypothetical protein
LLYKFYNTTPAYTYSRSKISYAGIIAMAAVLLLLAHLTNKIIHATPIDFKVSDIIPAIQIMVKRSLNGSNPYSPLKELGYTTPAGYMPMHWMPYSLAQLLHFDYRYITFAVWCVAGIVIFARSRHAGTAYSYTALILLAGCYYCVYRQEDNIIGVTAELLIAAYYMLLITGVNQKNAYAEGLLIGICLLSRYTLALWLPLWAFVLLVSGHKKHLLKATTVIVLMVVVIYVVPFLSRNWTMFYTTAHSYSNLSWEWQHVDDNDRPYHLFNGIGFAYWFYNRYGTAGYLHGFSLLRKVFFLLTAGSILLMGIWYWFKKEKIPYRIFLLASFKIYLSVFMSFLIVPYIYLMVTANFVTIAIFAEQARYRLGNART